MLSSIHLSPMETLLIHNCFNFNFTIIFLSSIQTDHIEIFHTTWFLFKFKSRNKKYSRKPSRCWWIININIIKYDLNKKLYDFNTVHILILTFFNIRNDFNKKCTRVIHQNTQRGKIKKKSFKFFEALSKGSLWGIASKKLLHFR